MRSFHPKEREETMMLGVPVQSSARSSLSDDGKRDWDEETKEFLDINYPGWQDPRETTMVPPVFPSSKNKDIDPAGYLAEKKIFDLLEEFGSKCNEPMFVVHSHKFSELIQEFNHGTKAVDKKWLNGEHDFVLIHRLYGLIFMQVKAAIRTRRVYGVAQVQLDKDKQGIASFLKRRLSEKKPKKGAADLMLGHHGFVVMPNCPKQADKTGLFKEDCEDVDAFSSWWETNVKGVTPTADFTPEIYEQLVRRFVGLVHTIPRLSHCIDTNQEGINFMTREQLKILLTSCPKQWIVGPAGSGKTWLLQEKVLELAHHSLMHDENTDGNNKILVLCFNRPLHQHLNNQFRSRLEAPLQGEDVASVIDVMTYDKFLFYCLGVPVQLNGYEKKKLIEQKYARLKASAVPKCRYRHIFVDEGQDLYFAKWPELLQLFLQKDEDEDEDDEPHFLWVMYDSNQHVQPSAEKFRCFRKYLKNSSRLTNVLRNTENIFNMSKKYYSSTMCPKLELGHKIVGHNVVLDDSLPEQWKLEEGAQLVAEHVQKLQGQNVQMKDICVLSEDVPKRDLLTAELRKQGIACQDAEDHIQTENQAVIVESIRRFKGLESKVVIMFYPLNTNTPEQLNGLLYSAISRCSCYLLILSTKTGCQLVKSNLIGKSQLSPMTGTKRALESTSSPAESKRPALIPEQGRPM